jgi:hemerythrin
MLIDKADVPEVAVPSMHQTHLNEVALVNRLHALIEAERAGTAGAATLKATVDEFEAHVAEHFAAEERLMLQTGFPAYPVHKGEHERVLAALRELVRAFRDDGRIEPLADYLANEHPRWAYNHIATMDTMTAYFIARAMPGR